jgi:hypothetical protein
VPLAIIGAGQGRTGTKSLKLALEELGFGPCYHGTDMYRNHPPGWHLWVRALDGEPVDWDVIFDGYKATTDSPACLFYRELAEKYPSAKVILTVRESNSWIASAQATYLSPAGIKTLNEPSDSTAVELLRKELTAGFGAQLENRESVIAAYERHNAEVQAAIPPERLLVYDVTQGWAPLCEFLGVPVPETPFPHANLKGIE